MWRRGGSWSWMNNDIGCGLRIYPGHSTAPLENRFHVRCVIQGVSGTPRLRRFPCLRRHTSTAPSTSNETSDVVLQVPASPHNLGEQRKRASTAVSRTLWHWVNRLGVRSPASPWRPLRTVHCHCNILPSKSNLQQYVLQGNISSTMPKYASSVTRHLIP